LELLSVLLTPRRKAKAVDLRDGDDIILFVCSLVCSFVCRQRVLMAAGAYRVG